MRIIHTSDWHLGKKLERFDRLAEQAIVLQQLVKYCDSEMPDVVLVAGDLFDQFNPSNEAMSLLYKTLRQLTRDGRCLVVAIAGNHDSPERIAAPDPLAFSCGIVLLALPESEATVGELTSYWRISRTESGFFEAYCTQFAYPLRVFAMPYANEARLKQYLGTENEALMYKNLIAEKLNYLAKKFADSKGVNLGIAHLFVSANGKLNFEEPDGERSIVLGGANVLEPTDFPNEVQYWALGHLHKHHFVERKSIWYSGSLLQFSFDEANQLRGFLTFKITPDNGIQQFDFQVFDLPKKVLRIEAQSVGDALLKLSNHINDYIELHLSIENSLAAQDRRALVQANPHLVNIVPIIKNETNPNHNLLEEAHLATQTVESLFIKYFESKHNGLQPSNEIMGFFEEVLNQNFNNQ